MWSLRATAGKPWYRLAIMIRFDSLDPDLLQALRDASWHSQRRVDASPWLDSLQQEGYQPNSKAEEILVALGGWLLSL